MSGTLKEDLGPRFRVPWPIEKTALAQQTSYPSAEKYYGNLRIRASHVTGPSQGRCLSNAIGTSLATVVYCFVALPMLSSRGFSTTASAIVGTVCCLIWIFSMLFLIAGCLTDPGTVPRGRSPSLDFDAVNSYRRYGVPDHLDVVMNSAVMRLKWCRTCHIYRPPRAVHCQMCDVCIERFDHHCPWMGNCVGKRNYGRFFYYTNLAALLVVIVVGGITAGFLHTFSQGAISWAMLTVLIVLAVFLISVGWFPIWICGYHWVLARKNQTTYEEIKEHYHDIINPHDHHGLSKNLGPLLWAPMRVSYLSNRCSDMVKRHRPLEPTAAYYRGDGLHMISSDISQSDSLTEEYQYYSDDELDAGASSDAGIGSSLPNDSWTPRGGIGHDNSTLFVPDSPRRERSVSSEGASSTRTCVTSDVSYDQNALPKPRFSSEPLHGACDPSSPSVRKAHKKSSLQPDISGDLEDDEIDVGGPNLTWCHRPPINAIRSPLCLAKVGPERTKLDKLIDVISLEFTEPLLFAKDALLDLRPSDSRGTMLPMACSTFSPPTENELHARSIDTLEAPVEKN